MNSNQWNIDGDLDAVFDHPVKFSLLLVNDHLSICVIESLILKRLEPVRVQGQLDWNSDAVFRVLVGDLEPDDLDVAMHGRQSIRHCAVGSTRLVLYTGASQNDLGVLCHVDLREHRELFLAAEKLLVEYYKVLLVKG